MNSGFKYSIILHVAVLIGSLVYVSTHNDIATTDRIIDVDLVTIKPGDSTNLKNTPIVIKNKEVKKNNSVPEKPKADKPVRQNPTKQKEAVAVKASKKEIDSILDNLEKPLPNEAKSSGKENLATSDKPYDKSLPLTIAEQDNIKMQIERKFFNPIVSDFKPGEITIKIKLDMKKNGEIEKITVLHSSYLSNHESTFITLKESLVRAAHMASPLQGLDETRYEGKNGWQEIELIFDAYYLMH